MNPKYRLLYLMIGFCGLIYLIFDIIMTLPDIDPLRVLVVAIPDMIFFFCAYRTYPIEEDEKVSS